MSANEKLDSFEMFLLRENRYMESLYGLVGWKQASFIENKSIMKQKLKEKDKTPKVRTKLPSKKLIQKHQNRQQSDNEENGDGDNNNDKVGNKFKIKQSEIYDIKPKAEKQSRMLFNQFEYPNARKPLQKKKNPKVLLNDLKEKQEKFKEDPDARKVEAWKNAFERTKGVKVKDNVALLKRTLKSKDRKKKRSNEKIKTRLEKVKQDTAERQEKRTDNINKRKTEKLQKKIQRREKKF